MGNSQGNFEKQPLQETDHLAADKCIDGHAPSSTVVRMTMTTENWKGNSSLISIDGKVKARLALISSWKKEGAIIDPSGDRICVTKGKMTGFGSRDSFILTYKRAYDGQDDHIFAYDDKNKTLPLFKFAKVSVQDGMMKGEGRYSLITAEGLKPVFVGKRLTGIAQRIVIFDMNGKCVAKIHPTDYWKSGKQLEYEIAAGVDPYAIIALASTLFSGGGGANAGSGTGAYGG